MIELRKKPPTSERRPPWSGVEVVCVNVCAMSVYSEHVCVGAVSVYVCVCAVSKSVSSE